MKITKISDNEVTCYLNNSELEEYGLNVNEDTVNNENLKDKAVQNFFDLTLAVRDEIAKEYGLPVQCVEYIDMTPEYNGATLRYSLNDSTAGAYSYLNQVLGEVTEYLSGSVEKLIDCLFSFLVSRKPGRFRVSKLVEPIILFIFFFKRNTVADHKRKTAHRRTGSRRRGTSL